MARITAFFGRGQVTMTPELNYLLKPLGLYMVLWGSLMIYALRDPPRYKTIVVWSALVLFLRGVQRLLLTPELYALFSIPLAINILHSFYLMVMGSILFSCYLFLRKGAVTKNEP